ncbi:MAG: YraN family protein [Syntrophobacteraceae bacterium]|nr:YraN family protein [Syntrophobacteraceae bacterium]
MSMPTKSRYNKGKEGERIAAEYLCQCGLKILERNFRCPSGEIDLVAKEGKTIVFVEVRSRQTGEFCTPEESLSVHKFRRIAKAALWYVKQRGQTDSSMRFDVVALRWNGEEPEINWIVNAFEPR